MYRARTAFQNLVPFLPNAAGPEKFAIWVRGAASKAGDILPPGQTHPRQYSSAVPAESFLNGSSSTYVEDMYNSWLADPSSVHAVSSFVSRHNSAEPYNYL